MTNIVNNININRSSLHDVFEALCTSFILESIKLGEKIFSIRFEGYDNKTANDDFERFIKENNFIDLGKEIQIPIENLELSVHLNRNVRIENPFHTFYRSEHSYCHFFIDKGIKYIECKFISKNENIFNSFLEMKSKWTNKKEYNYVNLLISTQHGFKLRPLGKTDWPDLIEDNYKSETIKDIKFLLQDLNNQVPLGRLNVISGPPGVGKSFLIKHILKSAPKGKLILIQPDEFNKIGSSEVLNFFSGMHQENEPIILVIEDADSCLVRRQDNQSNISALLNLTDGILGHLLDIRVIATTNAKHLEMDSALLRPGRLNKKIEVDLLNSEMANEIYNRLRTENNYSTSYNYYKEQKSLAQVYMDGLEHTNNISKNKRIGF